MVHTLHEDQFPVSSLGMRLVLKGSAELLNGHISVKDSIIRSTAEIQEQSRIKNKRVLRIPAYRTKDMGNIYIYPTQILSPHITGQQGCE